jgi:hypothetical protein
MTLNQTLVDWRGDAQPDYEIDVVKLNYAKVFVFGIERNCF